MPLVVIQKNLTSPLLFVSCITPCWIRLFLFRIDGGVDINGVPTWCEDSMDTATTNEVEYYDPLSQIEYDDEVIEHIANYEVVVRTISCFLFLSMLYTFLDLIVSMSIWSASNLGTPTDLKARDDIMRSLIWIKVTFVNLLLACTFAAGIVFVVYGRQHNYGCGVENDQGIEAFEVSSRVQSSRCTQYSLLTGEYSLELCLLYSILHCSLHLLWGTTLVALYNHQSNQSSIIVRESREICNECMVLHFQIPT